jgi:hypothetical protein
VATEGFEEVDAFEAKIAFDVSAADPGALEMNCYDEATWRREAKPEAAVVSAFSRFLDKHATLERVSKAGKAYRVAALAGHNIAAFDVPRLSAMFKRHGRFLAADCYRPLDTMHLAWWCSMGGGFEVPNFGQLTLCSTLGIDASGAHDALADVRMCVQLARALHERFPRVGDAA